MKKVLASLLLLFAAGAGAWAQQGGEKLAGECAAYLGAYFQGQAGVRLGVVALENRSALNDAAVQKLYQLLLSRLEAEKGLRPVDLLLAVSGGRGEFNLSRAHELDFQLELKLLQNRGRVGLGVALFSRLQDRLAALKYFEADISGGEMELLQSRSFAVAAMGFAKILELEAREGLMDVRSLPGADGREQVYFFYPDEVVVYEARETRLEKRSQIALSWGRPFYPTLHPEGRLLLFHSGQELLLAAGGNFSPQAQVLALRDGSWQEAGRIDFVPLRLAALNGIPYLVGARYAEGQNFFQERLYFLPWGAAAESGGLQYRQAFPAMALDVSADAEGRLQAIHAIDRDYAYRLLATDFAARAPITGKSGAALAVLDNAWLALSDHSRGADQLFFYDIRDGGLRPVYAGKIDGEVQFLAAGSWQGMPGFWAGVLPPGGRGRLVQFWGKSDG